ncbi:DUF4166 domain-containing protein [Haloarcula amylovorans]|uniref:DUF4166 domain-containing protein n=1 Tax=Haloarcula amylovorans TaxID=2562280 RepID=UPI001076A586|nr:DUF4166 domain-containing protein [Halomicroarcula amylolytica]
MTGVYERALGEATADLHPKVRERYSIGPDDGVTVGTGRMDISRGTHVLPALYAMTSRDMLFPEAGHGVPFSVTTVGYRLDGREAMTTHRTFEFDETRRHFDSVTVWDAEGERLLDFLGRGGLVATELHPRVEAGSLVVEAGRQWLHTGDRYLRLPGSLAAGVEVRDRYDESDERYHVLATVENVLAGHILSYRGAFTQARDDREDGPDLRPIRTLPTLPPR